MLQPQVLAQERRFWLQIEQPDTEDKGCERTEARGEEGDGRDEGGGEREECSNNGKSLAATYSIAAAAVPCRFRALPLAVVRLDVPRKHRALASTSSTTKVRAGRQLARRPALIPACGQPHHL